jgi:group I intron endonuclease
MTGIYMIKNIITGKCYIGKSETNIEDRWKRHLRDLRNDKHRNKDGKRDKLQRAWNKYGEENFIFGVIEEYNIEECNEREIYWIAYYDSFYNGYNQTKGGEGSLGKEPWNKGKKDIYSNETKQKISESVSEAIKGEKNPFYGKTHTYETKQKISEAHKGKILTEEHKKKISKAIQGEKHWRYIKITDEMIDDYKNGIKCKDFCSKYNVSPTIWNKMRKQLVLANIYIATKLILDKKCK